MAAEIATLKNILPDTCPMYCDTPKKQNPQTNQLKQIAIVRARRRGVRKRARNEARSWVELASTTIFCMETSILSVGRPFL